MNNNLVNELSWRRFLAETAVYNGLLSTLILGMMRWNPGIWAHDYPPDIREKFGPVDARTKRQTAIAAVPFFLIMFGSIIRSNLRLKRQNGGRLSLKAAFANAFGLIFSGWLFDLTILDWLIFVTITPDIVVLPGTEGLAGYDDYAFHLREHLRALPMLAGVSLVFALLTASRPWRWSVDQK
jgi:hypothetical protein